MQTCPPSNTIPKYTNSFHNKIITHLSTKVPTTRGVGIKKSLCEGIILLVDPSQNFWNTFIEIALEWKDDLKITYEIQDMLVK